MAYLTEHLREITKSAVHHSNAYFDVKYLRRNAWNYISCASSEVSNFITHHRRLQHIAAAAVLNESPITEVHHQTTRLIVQCNCKHKHQLLIQ